MAHAQINFISDALRRSIAIEAIFPTDHMCSPTKKIPHQGKMKTMYYLEGSTTNSHRVVTHTMLEAYAEDNNLCVIIVSGEDKWYGNSLISGDLWGNMVTEDLVNFTRATFNLSDKREDTYIAGFSMGGFGAITCGLRHPEIFGKICLHAPALVKALILNSYDEPGHDNWTKTNYETMFGLKDVSEFENSEFDYEKLVDDVSKMDVKPDFILTVGNIDGLRPPLEELRDKLKEKGFNVEFYLVEGNHNWCHALNQGLEKICNALPTDDFGENFRQTGAEANYEWPDFFIWRAHYNTKNGVAHLPYKMKDVEMFSTYRVKDLGEIKD